MKRRKINILPLFINKPRAAKVFELRLNFPLVAKLYERVKSYVVFHRSPGCIFAHMTLTVDEKFACISSRVLLALGRPH